MTKLKQERINAASKTRRLVVLVEPGIEEQIDNARGRVPVSAWIRDAIELKLRLCPNVDFQFSMAFNHLEMMEFAEKYSDLAIRAAGLGKSDKEGDTK